MNLTYAQRKRIKSLATRYLRAYDGLVDAKELNEIYHSDFISFTENLLVDLCGFKKEEPKPEVYRPRKVGTRPPKRKPGERPLKIGEKLNSTETAALEKYKKIEEVIESTVDPQQPDWYKKAWRGVMMQVHPDRLDLVSKDELNKLERLQIASRLRNNSDPELLVACCNTLEVSIDLATYEQERMLRISAEKIKEELKNMQSSLPWLWAESIVDNNTRAQLMKQVLQNSGYNPPDDIVLIQYITKNVIQ